MSSAEEKDLRAGHRPAVKVAGGKRIVQHKPPHEKEPRERKASGDEPEANGEEEEEQIEPSSSPTPKQTISGVVCKGDSDFPTRAVQETHNKPCASREFRSANNSTNVIQQPRK